MGGGELRAPCWCCCGSTSALMLRDCLGALGVPPGRLQALERIHAGGCCWTQDPLGPPPPSFELQPQHPPPTTTTRLPFASQPAPRRRRWTFTSGRRRLFLSTACGSALAPTSRSSRVADENVPQEPALARTKTLPRRGIVIPAQQPPAHARGVLAQIQDGKSQGSVRGMPSACIHRQVQQAV